MTQKPDIYDDFRDWPDDDDLWLDEDESLYYDDLWDRR